MTTQLSLYNDALLLCGERFLADLTENREPRRLLDQVWSSGGVRYCLEQGQWFFAMRTIQIDFDNTIQPAYGYQNAFSKPADWVLTSALCSDGYFRVPLTQYVDEAGYWYSDLTTIFVRYVSQDINYGLDLGIWPDSFREFVAAYLASQIVLTLSNNERLKRELMELRTQRLKNAKSRSAMAEATHFSAQGSWSRARLRGSPRRDGGNPNTSGNLIG